MKLTRPTSGDLVAGVSVALVAIPQSLAYAELAGLPAQVGLLASALPPLLAAPFVSSRYLQTGPVALTSLLTFGALSGLADVGTAEYVALAGLLALLVGAFRILLGLARLGGVAYLLSEPVLLGFTTGAAVLIIASQLPRVVDVDPDRTGVVVRAASALADVGDWSVTALAFAAGTAVVVLGGRRLHRLFPGVLVAVVAAVVVSSATGYSGSVVGRLDGGLLSLTFDFPWSSTTALAGAALAIALVGFAEPASIARALAREKHERWDANRELVSQGVANLAAGFSGAFPVGGSFSRSSLNRLAGATGPWSGAVTGAVVLAALPLTSVLADLPAAVLGAVVMVAVVQLVRLGDLVALFRRSVPEAAVGVVTLAATLAFAPRVERGVLVGVGLALALHLRRELRMGNASSRRGDTLTIAPRGVLWFATVPHFERIVRTETEAHPDATTVVLDLSGVGRLDYSGTVALQRMIGELSLAGAEVDLVNPPPGRTAMTTSAPTGDGGGLDALRPGRHRDRVRLYRPGQQWSRSIDMAQTALGGNPVNTSGDLPVAGSAAPAFSLTGSDLGAVTSDSLKGQRVVLNIFPSIDTPTCANSVRAFNERAGGLENTTVLCVSADLPFAQSRFCGAEGIENVSTASTFKSPEFAAAYGVGMVDGKLEGLLARAVVVIDEAGNVAHSQLVAEIANEPDYDAALGALG
jgi:SulP family sulfate permease